MTNDLRFYFAKCGLEFVIHPGLWGLLLHRCGSFLYRLPFRKFNPLWYLYLVLNVLFVLVFRIELPPSCRIGKNLYLPHPYGLVMGPLTIIGNGVTIGPWVVIGHNFDEKCPVILDGCYIGSKATLLGGITIGTGSTVGANMLVTRDVAPGSVLSLNKLLYFKERK